MTTKRINEDHQETGLVLLALIAIMLILGIIGYTFVSIVSTERESAAAPYDSIKAIYITEGALEIGKKYISDQGGVSPNWAPNTDLYVNWPLGDGAFWINMTWPATGSITLSVTGNVN